MYGYGHGRHDCCGYEGYSYGGECGTNGGFVLIVVLFILLIIVGASVFC